MSEVKLLPRSGRRQTRRSAMHYHPMYRTWMCMKDRCRNPNHKSYRNYGGRGIYIHPDWLHFWTFAFDAHGKPQGTTIDRIDNNGPYAAWNFRWATYAQQRNNSRNAHMITFNDETMCLADWARRLKMSEGHLRKRVQTYGATKAIAQGPPWSRQTAFLKEVGP